MEKEMSYQVIKQITNNYDEKRVLGRGGFGTVYKAVHGNEETIAVKVFDMPSSDDNEFRKEFDNLKRLKHENIVQLVGFCNDIEEIVHTDKNGMKIPAGKLHTALCLEYVQNGHLGDYISDETTGLHWLARYKIIKGVCEGLKYLHEGLKPPMLHLDLKPENILLDKDMIPKVADFGLSRLFGEEKTTKTASNCGSRGYMPPEYIEYQVISEKYDIYSLGVIMAKIISGKEGYKRIDQMPRKKYTNQVHDEWRKRLREVNGMTSGALEVYCHQLRRCIELALDCLQKNRQERPTIQQLVSNLTETETMMGNLGLTIEQFSDGESILHRIDIPENPSPENDPGAMITTPLKEMSWDYLQKITDDFSDDQGYGISAVYRGILEDGQVISVVKFLSDSTIGRDRYFMTDTVRRLSMLKHENTVKFLGYCREARRKFVEKEGRHWVMDTFETLLCHEYCSGGTLSEYIGGLQSVSCSESDWILRFRIIMGICRGLHFMFEEFETPFIHADLKPENVLLDKMMPKILYFGTNPEGDRLPGHTPPPWAHKTHVYAPSGYEAPEYLYKDEISPSIDIYSLGIIILEMIAGGRDHRISSLKDARRFIDNVHENWNQERILSVYLDLDDCQYDHVEICLKIGLKCVEIDSRKRPSIVEIMDKLNILSKEGQYYVMQEEVVKYELLEVHPRELCFPFEPKKTISCSLQLRNKGDDHVAFMLESETPNRYLKKLPLCGIVPRRCTYTHAITMRKQAQQKPGELLTLHMVEVGKHNLQVVGKDSIAKVYENFFNKANTEIHEGLEVQEVTLTVNCDPLVQEPTRATFKIITTPNALEVSSINVHPAEPWIITTSKGSLQVWNYKTLETLVPFKDIINDPVLVAKFIEREKWLVAGDANGGIHVYSYDEHEEVELFDAHYSSITSLAVHPTCPFLLSSSEDEDNMIKLWDWDNNWRCARRFLGHDDKVMQVIFNSKSMGTFTSASMDGTVKIWSVDKDEADNTLNEKNGGLLCVDNFERNNVQHLIAGCMDKTTQVWNMEEGCVGELEGHKERVTAVNLHPELPLLITGSFDGTVRLWSSDTYKLEAIIDFNLGQVYAFGFIKDLRRIVVGCQQGMAIMEIPVRR